MSLPQQLSADHLYHQHNRSLPLADRVGYIARLRMYRLFLDVMRPNADSRILDIGVTDELDSSSSANLLEQLYPYRDCITCAGITDGRVIERAYPGVRHVRIAPGERLPFADQAFGIVYSNAVLEHVGSNAQQARFVDEACRVGRNVFIAMPNRLFPVEVHTGIPLLHILPKRLFRTILRPTRFRAYSLEENLNYVWAGELRRMYPKARSARTRFAGIGIGPFRSNLVSYCLSDDSGRPSTSTSV